MSDTVTTQPSGAATAEATPRTPRAATDRARAERRFGLLLCAPAIIVMLAVTAYPILYAVWLSLQRYDLRAPNASSFVGLANYGAVLTNHLWWTDFLNTVIITVASVAIELVLGMGIALVMHRSTVVRGAVRTNVLIPYGIVTVVAALAWQYAWTPDLGFLAGWLHAGAPLTSRGSALAIIILAEVWKTTPFMSLLLLAGLALVPDELLEAARVDGASAWQRFTRITLPLMKPAILVALLFRTLDAFRIFDNIFILTSGGHDTESASILGYNQLFVGLNLGVGSTVSVLIAIAIGIVAVTFIKGFGAAAPGQGSRR